MSMCVKVLRLNLPYCCWLLRRCFDIVGHLPFVCVSTLVSSFIVFVLIFFRRAGEPL